MVTITQKEYQKLKKKEEIYDAFWGSKVQIRKVVPVVYLSGKSAEKLDRRVARTLRDHAAGKTKLIKSLRDLM